MSVGQQAGRSPPEFENLMLANYAQIVRRSVLTTAAVGVVMIILSVVLSGIKGLLGAVLGVRFAGTTAFSSRLFGLTALACILAWSASQVVWSMRRKQPYVEPSGR